MTYDVGNQGPGLGQAQKCDRVKLVNGIPILPTRHHTFSIHTKSTCQTFLNITRF
jgi:hypothetical protein